MAYTSDTRIKNILTDVDFNVRRKLKDKNLNVNLEFRIFDESNEDAKLWSEGGLCFQDPITNENLGSNDGGWSLNGKPILIVEGTFGTERGQFGDGQLNRISHSLGPALNGLYGVTLVPYHGESYVKDEATSELISDNIKYKIANLHKSMALFSLIISDRYEGKYLVIDPYSNILADLLFELILKSLGMSNKLETITNRVLDETKKYVKGYKYGGLSKQSLSKIYYTDGTSSTDIARYYTHNLESLTTSTKRDGHGLLGKNLIEMYMAKNKSTSIFIRLNNDDFKYLKSRNSKEFKFITTNPRIDAYSFDELVFEDENLKNKILSIKNENLHTNTEKSVMNEIQNAFNTGKIKIIKHQKA